MMSLMATDLVYSEAARLLSSFLGIEISTSQTYRVAVSAGEALSEACLYEPVQPAPEDKVYALADGSMISTDDGWKELKLGRVFCSHKGSEVDAYRKAQYCAHLGSSEVFGHKLEQLLGKVVPSSLIFISDGAPWISRWIDKKYPQAIQILDFYHAFEHLAKASEGAKPSADWLDTQKVLLLESKAEQVLKNVAMLKKINVKKREALEKYYRNNLYRMDYAYYLQQGWHIGSGAVESAHKSVIHKRMKLSGQRWGSQVEPIIKLRILAANQKSIALENLFKVAA
jgi:hypothetical protein